MSLRTQAKVLREVVAQAKSRDISVRYESVVKLLQNERLGLAEKNQKELRGELQRLLDILLKENRAERLESEQRRLRRLLKDVNRLIKRQRGVKARTEGGDDTDRLAAAQEKIADKTGNLREDLERNGVPGEEETAESESSEDQSGEPQEDDSQNGESGSQDGSKNNKSEEEEGSEGKSVHNKSEGEQNEQSSDGKQPSDSSSES